MVAVADDATVTPVATGYGRIVAALLQVQGDETPILDRQALLDGSDLMNRIERFRKVLRQLATHDRLFDTLGNLQRSICGSLSYFRTDRDQVRTLLYRMPRKRTASIRS
jgi:hypothetical protein